MNPSHPSTTSVATHIGEPPAAASTADITNTEPRKETPLPWNKLGVLLAVRLSEPVNFTLILPFIYQMVKDFDVAESPKDIAFYASLLFASFSVCQTMMVMYWGRLSDRIGRRPVMIIGLLGNLVSAVLFGMSKTFTAALLARSFNGLMAGNVAVVKSVVAEISDSTNRPRMMAMLPLMWNLGTVAGTAVGGLFADPANQYPRLFGNSKLFREYPYLLPCLIGCSVTTFGLVMGLFKFEETLVIKREHIASSSVTLTSADESTPLVQGQPRQRTIRELLTPTVVRVMATNVIVCLAISIDEQAYPIFAATDPQDGGLGFSTRSIGFSMAVASVFVIYLQLVAYPRMERKMGALKCYRRGQKIIIPFYLALPFLTLLAGRAQKQIPSLLGILGLSDPMVSQVLLWSLLIFLLLVHVTGTVFLFTSLNLLTANLAPSRADLGFMNGAQQLAMASTRILGPLMSGYIWSWSIKHTYPFPFNSHLLWNVCVILTLCAIHISKKIPESVNIFKPDLEDENETRRESV